MSKVEVLGCLVMVGLAAMGCGSAPCPEGYVRLNDVCMLGGRDAAPVRDAAWGADGQGGDGAVTDGEAADAGLPDSGRATDVDAAERMADACVAGSETCNDLDDDCDGAIDEGLARPVFYADGDGDGYGVGTGVAACAASATHSATLAGDCNDECASCHPGGTEICDEIDQDCVDGPDNGVRRVFFRDGDGDGFGSPTVTATACSAPVDFVDNPDDCDDILATVNPAAAEACNDIDDDCSGIADEGLPTQPYYIDVDEDGYAANTGGAITACGPRAGFTARTPISSMASTTIDCAPNERRAFPGQLAYFSAPIAGEPATSAFDYNCDTSNTVQYFGGGSCSDIAGCGGTTAAFVSGAPITRPACGATGTFQVSCSFDATLTCRSRTETRAQACR